MFRPLCMAISRFSVQYSVRRFLFLVWSGGGARSHFKMYGWYRSDVWCPGCSSWAWSAVVVCAWRSSHGRCCFSVRWWWVCVIPWVLFLCVLINIIVYKGCEDSKHILYYLTHTTRMNHLKILRGMLTRSCIVSYQMCLAFVIDEYGAIPRHKNLQCRYYIHLLLIWRWQVRASSYNSNKLTN